VFWEFVPPSEDFWEEGPTFMSSGYTTEFGSDLQEIWWIARADDLIIVWGSESYLNTYSRCSRHLSIKYWTEVRISIPLYHLV
jgi:hypothetical protein